ncbi:hypothetical protein ES332_D05G434100v1 [Gossypium tomentosum]|uniref:Uncharacterized protein n=1 Tax=Gossypium tomentosum TaxID=34277 RepID=A0A5D2L6Y6_GOSTO|nr:hypothetical protein ES332_D05G434100v1 [Gossypium tomentosum]
MGNCLRHQSSTQWAGDDWGTTVADYGEDDGFSDIKTKEKGIVGDHHQKDGFITTSSSPTVHEVKVKITKKQLEELLGRVDVKELSVQQVLAQLINVSNQFDETNQRSWRPALQSIPEVN